MPLADDLDRFYSILEALDRRLGGSRLLADCHGRLEWPKRGVYFFFEEGERRNRSSMPRVVRVGTHAVSIGSGTTLWDRLKQHRGKGKPSEPPGGGNHRGSIFRRHVGMALIRAGCRACDPLGTWGVGSSAPAEVRTREAPHERLVSDCIGRMRVLWVEVDDEPGSASVRSVIEKNSIGLLSAAASLDPSSEEWLGRYAADERIRSSGLWNVNYVGDSFESAFLDVFARLVRGESIQPSSSTAPIRSPGS